MLRRSKDKIIADILEICLMPGAAKTQVVYQANLNFKTILPYLDLLTRGELLEAVPGKSTIYKTTAKGEMALKALRAIEEIIPERYCCILGGSPAKPISIDYLQRLTTTGGNRTCAAFVSLLVNNYLSIIGRRGKANSHRVPVSNLDYFSIVLHMAKFA